MEDIIKKEIKNLEERFKIGEEVAIVLICANLVKLYLIQNFGEQYKKRIISLVNNQINIDIQKYKINHAILSDEVKNLLENGDIDIITSLYDKIMDPNLRKIFGKFYTHPALVEHILDSISLNEKPDGKLIDLACGAGVFLSRAIKRIIEIDNSSNKQILLKRIIEQIYGIDIDETACSLSKLSLLLTTLPIWKESFMKNMNFKINFNIYHFNSLNVFKINSPIIGSKFDYVVGNPPYIEAKKLPKKDKELCIKNFPEVAKGAFDLYICFIHMGMKILNEGGYLGFVLPNKFLVAKYSHHIRERILENYQIKEICDISNLKYFKDTDVYPILLTLKNKKDGETLKTISNIKDKKDFENKQFDFIEFKQEKYKVLDGTYPFFTFEKKIDKDILFKIVEKTDKRLNDFLTIKTTVSFHKKGLREQYISKNVKSNKFKYLGGISYARKNEVDAFNVEWRGYFINYDRDGLKKIGNHLPHLSNFTRPKIIFCQHAKRMLAYADISGEWVTKDVFPIAFIEGQKNIIKRTYYYTGLLNSNIFSYIYGLIWKGIQISEGYFHFLMSIIPVPSEEKNIITRVSGIVKKLQEIGAKEETLFSELNGIFYKIYHLSDNEIKRVEEYNKIYLIK
jgi:type I restriction-modification system DNA methylase subunit